MIGRANIEDGTLSVTDRSQKPARTTMVTQINLTIGDVSETTPISFDLRAALQAASQNLQVRGTIGPLANPAAIPLRLDGACGPLGPQALYAEGLHLEALLTPASVQVSQFDARAFNGSFQLAGQVPLRTDGEMTLKGEMTKIALAQVLRVSNEDASRRIEGNGNLRLNLHATGASADAIRSTVTGQVAVDIKDAALKDFNVVREVLGRLHNLPVIGDLVSGSVKPKYARLAAEPDTHFQILRATFQVADQRLHSDNLTMEATDFGVRATGWIGFNQEADLAGVLTMSKAFSRDVVADVKEAKYLLDEQDQLALPFRLRGKIGVAKPEPDTNYLIARLTQGVASGGVKDLVGKLLGTTQRPAATPKSDELGTAIGQGLRRLFGR